MLSPWVHHRCVYTWLLESISISRPLNGLSGLILKFVNIHATQHGDDGASLIGFADGMGTRDRVDVMEWAMRY